MPDDTQTVAPAAVPGASTFSVDYPDRELNRLSTGLRIFAAIPIVILLGALTGGSFRAGGTNNSVSLSTGGLLFLAPALMIVFRRRYPEWWFDWNLQLMRFMARVGAYVALMDDRYPSTTDEQAVRLMLQRPDAEHDLNRWLPLVKWFLAIPHLIVLMLLHIAAFFVVIFAWFAIVFSGRYPRGAFEFVEGVMRWDVRVTAYAFILITDDYPPFRLSP